MTTYYMRSRDDIPHRYNPLDPDVSRCGRMLGDAKPVSELQVLVYLGGETCSACTPTAVAVREAKRLLPSRGLRAPLPDPDGSLWPVEFPTALDAALREPDHSPQRRAA
jgi:hypothetical protein